MKFRKVQLELVRSKLDESDFYEDIIFANDTVKEVAQKKIASWMLSLEICETVQAEIKKFKELFSKVDGISFPIEIQNSNSSLFSIDISIVDRNGKQYYISKDDIYDCYNITEYYIGRRNTTTKSYIDYENCYKICKNEVIKKLKATVVKINLDGTNKESIYETYYNQQNNMQVIEFLENEKRKIRIEYPIVSKEIGKKIFEDFLEWDDTKWYYYDVFPIFKWLVNKMENYDMDSLHIIAEIDKDVYSEIQMGNNIVQTYTVAQVISENEIHVIKKIFAKNIDEFLKEK